MVITANYLHLAMLYSISIFDSWWGGDIMSIFYEQKMSWANLKDISTQKSNNVDQWYTFLINFFDVSAIYLLTSNKTNESWGYVVLVVCK